MKRNGLPKKWILGVNNDLNLLRELEKEITKTSLECCLDRANTYREAEELIVCYTYDLVVLDPTMTRGLQLMGIAILRNLPVAIHSNSPTSLEISNGFKRSQNGRKPQVYFIEGGFGEPSFPLEHLLTKPLSHWWSRLSENIRFNFPVVGRPPEWRSPLAS
jgi:hypothetical protein